MVNVVPMYCSYPFTVKQHPHSHCLLSSALESQTIEQRFSNLKALNSTPILTKPFHLSLKVPIAMTRAKAQVDIVKSSNSFHPLKLSCKNIKHCQSEK